jgi:histidyl-tRNA synthetase
MQDVLPDDRRYWDVVIDKARTLAERFGFQRIDIPVIEYTDLFERGVGTASDIFVQKEIYTLDEGDGTSISLRPEFTAGLVRAYIQNGMGSWPQPVKLYTTGPIFRRERPQAGRFRQHSQFDVEIMGEMDPAADVEVMMLAMMLYQQLGYRGLEFQLNSTGCRDCRPAYIERLKAYLHDFEDQLAPVDQTRLSKNPLRVLDSKEPGMDALLANAPHIVDHLCDDCADHFQVLQALLNALGQPYTINFRLVRGLDYYEKTVFEVWAEGIGAQAAVCGGGRYDLAREVDGTSVPSVGFGSGIERIVLGMQEAGLDPAAPAQPPVMLAHFGGQTKISAAALAFQLRTDGIGTRLAFARGRRSLKSQLREANKQDVQYVLIMGEQEVIDATIAVKPLSGGDQIVMAQSDVAAWLHERLSA